MYTGSFNFEKLLGFTSFSQGSGSVRNARRKCKAKTNFAACGQNLGEYAAKPNLPGLGLRRLFFLKLTPMVRLGNREKTPKQYAEIPKQKPHLPGLGVKSRSKNGQLNGSG